MTKIKYLTFHDNGWEDYLFWQKNNKIILKRINLIIKETIRSPFEGIGKPEPLKGDLSGFWSRRIDSEHRIIYKIIDDSLIVAQCRYHY